MKSTAKTSAARFRMGSFEGDLRSGELHSLASTAKIVTRRDIKKRLWPDDTIVDHHHIINVTIPSQRSSR